MARSRMSYTIVKPFTEHEYYHAIALIDASSHPGEVGVTRPLCMEFWDVLYAWAFACWVIQFLIMGTYQIWYVHVSSSSFWRGGNVRQCRPITLLSTTYNPTTLVSTAGWSLFCKILFLALKYAYPGLMFGQHYEVVQWQGYLCSLWLFCWNLSWSVIESIEPSGRGCDASIGSPPPPPRSPPFPWVDERCCRTTDVSDQWCHY